MQKGLRIALFDMLKSTHNHVRKRSLSMPLYAQVIHTDRWLGCEDLIAPIALDFRPNERAGPVYLRKRNVLTRSYCSANNDRGNKEGEVTTYGRTIKTIDSEDTQNTTKTTASEDNLSYLEARRRGILHGRRRLSPLQRVGGMIMRRDDFEEPSVSFEEGRNVDSVGFSQPSKSSSEDKLQFGEVQSSSPVPVSPKETVRSRSPPFMEGEYVIIMRENMKRQEKIVRLIKLGANLEFKCKFGNLLHADIIGGRNGTVFVTGMDIELLVRRPSLEEFVLYMKRTPVIAYPKDCCTMLMMIDASPGDVLLEAGSGSGAMTLFSSRAVGHSGQILSFERVELHQKKAMKNLDSWRRSWDLSHDVKWPDNVTFYQAPLQDCGKHIGDVQVDGAIIDMEEPWRVMKTVSERLKTGKSMTVYVANLTQIVDIAEAIRKQRLPLVLETTLEVSHKVWVVNPARRHAGIVLGESIMTEGEEHEGEDTIQGVKYIADEVPKYLTRPHHQQPAHTAFLVKIRRVLTPSSTFKV